jgi:hypothetical protein
MGDNNINDRPIPPQAAPRRRRTVLLTGVATVVLAVALGILFRDCIPGPWRSDDVSDNPFPPGALADYVPENSQAVLAVNLRSLLDSPVGRRHLMSPLKELVQDGGDSFQWIHLLGINPFDDLDSLTISFAPGSGRQPLWLARGRVDRWRFQTGPGKLQKKAADHFRLWEYADRQRKKMTTLAPVGDALVVSDTPARVLAALKQAANPRPTTIRDATLRELLRKVDRRQSIWLAASFRKFGPVERIDNRWLEMILRPLFRQTESVYGGLICAGDVRAELHFQSATEENAIKLEADLKNICNVAGEVAQGAALLLRGQEELVPLVRLLGTGETNREGKSVSLRCRLLAEQLRE